MGYYWDNDMDLPPPKGISVSNMLKHRNWTNLVLLGGWTAEYAKEVEINDSRGLWTHFSQGWMEHSGSAETHGHALVVEHQSLGSSATATWPCHHNNVRQCWLEESWRNPEMGVSWNGGTPQVSSIFIACLVVNHLFYLVPHVWRPAYWGRILHVMYLSEGTVAIWLQRVLKP